MGCSRTFFSSLYNIVFVLPYINMHLPWVYTCSPSWTPLPPPSPYHPSGSSQCTSPKLPVSCIEPGPAIHFLYDIIHVLMAFSQIIPHSLSHRVQKTVLYLCVSFAVSHIGTYCFSSLSLIRYLKIIWTYFFWISNNNNLKSHLLILWLHKYVSGRNKCWRYREVKINIIVIVFF